MGLVLRGEHLIRLLKEHAIALNLPAIISKIIPEIRELNKQIQLSSGKQNSAKKRERYYRKIFRLARKALRAFEAAHVRATAKLLALNIPPSERKKAATLIDWLEVDMTNLSVTITNADKRINKGEKVKVVEKVLSLSDEDAAMIAKGQREPVLGYKPQIARSGNGYVTAIIVPEGNANDSGQLENLVQVSMKRTGILPSVISIDDGYTSADGLEKFRSMGINVVSFSGSKGKKITPKADYESKAYSRARNDRSAVESLMFTLKHNNDLETVMRRGIDPVREELLEKVVAYNFFRTILLRQRRKEQAAAA